MINNQLILTVVLSLMLGSASGFMLGQQSAESTHSDQTAIESHGHNETEPIELPADSAPTVTLLVTEDPLSGWNVRATTTNFRFTPEDSGLRNVIGEGHAHLYVDGKKVARLYEEYFHYPVDFDGERTFRVTLNANQHNEYRVSGEPVADEVTVTHNH